MFRAMLLKKRPTFPAARNRTQLIKNKKKRVSSKEPGLTINQTMRRDHSADDYMAVYPILSTSGKTCVYKNLSILDGWPSSELVMLAGPERFGMHIRDRGPQPFATEEFCEIE